MIDDDVVKRYSSDYESNLDPFAAFSSKVRNVTNLTDTHHNHYIFHCLQERHRKYINLSGPDKATLVMVCNQYKVFMYCC